MHDKMRSRVANACCALTGAAALFSLVACGGGQDYRESFIDTDLSLPVATPARYTEPAADVSEYQRHLDTATANAGIEFAGEQRRQWCYSVENAGAPPELQNTTVVPMTRLFDNLHFTGRRWVGQFVLTTANGYFLLDGLNSTADAQQITVPALTAAGFDPAQLKGILPTHGHGDHYNGAKYMQDTYGGPVYIGSADAAALTAANARNATAFSGSITTTSLDSTILTPQTLTIDGTTLTLLSTPGHTPGTFSGILPARLGATTYKLVFWGGTGTPNTLPLARQYLDGAERLYQLARAENAIGTIHTHPFADGSLARIDRIQSGSTDGSNPFLMGQASTLRSLSVLRECSAAKVNALDATVVNPVWLTTTVEAVASARQSTGGNRNVSARVRVNDPYGPVAGAAVTLGWSGGSESCTATTDATGEAGCGFLTDADTRGGQVTVRHAGASTAAKVWLASDRQITLP